MSTINNTDTFLVNRGSTSYKITAANLMSTIQNSDLFLINRGSTSYKVTGSDIKSQLGMPAGVTKLTSATTKVNADYYNWFSGSNTSLNWNGTNYFLSVHNRLIDKQYNSRSSGYYSSGNHSNTSALTLFTLPFNFNGTVQLEMTPQGNPAGQYRLQCGGAQSAVIGGGSPFKQITCSGASNGTAVQFTADTSSNYQNSYAFIYTVWLNGVLIYYKDENNNWAKRQAITVEDSSVLTAGDYVYGDNNAIGVIINIAGNTAYVHDVQGDFSGSSLIFPISQNVMDQVPTDQYPF